jgi:hypothetical protein
VQEFLEYLMILQIDFSDSKIATGIDAAAFSISYRLNDLAITKKWIEAFNHNFRNNPKISGRGFFFGSQFYTSEYLISEMNLALDILRPHFREFLSTCPVPSDPLSQEVLSEIHNYFEGLDQQPNWIEVVSRHDNVHPTAQWLNLLIHMYECLPAPRENFHIDINFDPTMKWPIETDDYQSMIWDRLDGDLLVSYGTTGVPPLHAFRIGPPAVPTFQTTYSCDLQLYFEGPSRPTNRAAFDEWLVREHGIERRNGLPHPGQFKIGELASGQSKKNILDKFANFDGLPFVSSIGLKEV